jgi:hypothetical protein
MRIQRCILIVMSLGFDLSLKTRFDSVILHVQYSFNITGTIDKQLSFSC